MISVLQVAAVFPFYNPARIHFSNLPTSCFCWDVRSDASICFGLLFIYFFSFTVFLVIRDERKSEICRNISVFFNSGVDIKTEPAIRAADVRWRGPLHGQKQGVIIAIIFEEMNTLRKSSALR